MPHMSDVHGWSIQITGLGICQWITDRGGPSGLTVPDIFILVEAYLQHEQLPFEPTIDEIFGCVEYYLGHISTGNWLTGCEFT